MMTECEEEIERKNEENPKKIVAKFHLNFMR
jgi:hypothetical protein